MAKITQKPQVNCDIVFTVNESEARALDALAGYGDDAFIKTFYDGLGKAYMEKHEKGLRTFLQDVRTNLPSILSRLDNARVAFDA